LPAQIRKRQFVGKILSIPLKNWSGNKSIAEDTKQIENSSDSPQPKSKVMMNTTVPSRQWPRIRLTQFVTSALLLGLTPIAFGKGKIATPDDHQTVKAAAPPTTSGSPFDIVGQWSNFTSGHDGGVVVRPPYAYVMGAGVLHVFDISSSLREVGGLDLPDQGGRMVLSGDQLVIATDTVGLTVVDISIPTVPRLLGATAADVSNVLAVGGTYAYVANWAPPYALRIFDISDPSNLRLAGSYSTENSVAAVTLSGHFAYLAIDGNPVEVLDISVPTQPKFAGSIPVAGSPAQISIVGDYGYVTGSGTGLQTIDFSNPAAPQLTAQNVFAGGSAGIVVTGDLIQVLASDFSGGPTFEYLTFDRSDPAHPKPLGNYQLSGEPSGLASGGSFAYVAGAVGLEIIDASDPVHPAGLEIDGFGGIANAYDLAVRGSYAYLADGPAGLQVIDISNPRHPLRVGQFATPGSAIGIVLSDHLACLALGAAGVDIVDISDPLHPRHAGHFGSQADAIRLLGPYVCIQNGGLQLIDISDPTQPKVVGSHPPLANFAFAAHDSTLFVSHDRTLEVTDWSDPAHPLKLTELNTGSSIASLAAQGQYLYIGTGGDLSIWDVSHPDAPVKAGTYQYYKVPAYGLDGLATAAFTPDGRYAFVSAFGRQLGEIPWDDLVLVDVSNSARSVFVGRIGVPPRFSQGRSVVQDGLLFSAQGELGLTVRSLPGQLTILEPPQGEGVLFGDPAELTVGVYSTSPVQYQWYLGASGDTSRPIPNGTGPSLSLPPVWETASYWVRVKNQFGQLDSQTLATRPAPALGLKQLGRSPRLNDGPLSLALGEHLVYLVEADTFRILDVSDPARPLEVSQLKLGFTQPVGYPPPPGLTVSEPNACFWSPDTLQWIDVSDPAHPRLGGRYSTDLIHQVIVPLASSIPSPPRAYLAADTDGVIALDLSDPAELRRLSSYVFSSPVLGVASSGDYVLATTGGTLQVLDFRDPAHPQLVGSYTANNAAVSVLVSGHYALVNCERLGAPPSIPLLQILDISNPVHPQLVGSAGAFGFGAVYGIRAVLDELVIGFTDPDSPVLVGSAALRGNQLFTADSKKGLLIAELSPQLRVALPSLGPGTATVRWTGAPGVVLQQSHSLASPAWQDLEGTDGRTHIDLPRSVQPAFFRAVQR
jgi:hypothetical protein